MFRDKRTDEKIVHHLSCNDINEQNRKDWFADQYEKVIGTPLPRKELTTDEVLKRLKDSAEHRCVSEAKTYKTPVPQCSTVHYLEWRDSEVKKCTCPDQDCICRGAVIFSRKKIPRGERYIKSPLGRKLLQCFRKPKSPRTQNFIQRLADVLGVEASVQKDLERRGILSIRGAEFCISRCIKYYGAGIFPNSKYPRDKQKLWDNKMNIPSQENDTEERICDDYNCTVSTQSTVGPDGEFIIESFSHILFGSLGETVMKDIEGTELYISSYKCINDNLRNTSDNLFSLDKLLSWRERLNLREIKYRLSSFKRNIYSSIFEIKEPNTSKGSLATQFEEEQVNNKSSEKISISTPYKGVIIKVKKPQDSNNQIGHEGLQIPNNGVCEIPDNFKKQSCNPRDLDTNLKEMSSVLIGMKESRSPREETTLSQNQIEPTESKLICGSCIKQHQNEQSFTQKSKSNDTLVTELINKEIKPSYKQLEMHGQVSATIDNMLDFNVNKIKDTETVKDGIHADYLNLNQMKSKNKLEESNLSQKNSNMYQHVVESIENLKAAKQQLSKYRLFKESKNLKEPRNKITITSKDFEIITPENETYIKNNISNFFKKRLYKLSLEHLQKIKINKFSKSLSYTYNSGKLTNENDTTSEKIFKDDIKQNKENFFTNDEYKKTDITHIKSEPNEVLSNSKTFTTKSQLETISVKGRSNSKLHLKTLLLPNISGVPLIHKTSSCPHLLHNQSHEVTSMSKNKVNYLEQSDNATPIAGKEKSNADQSKSNSTNKVYEVVRFSDSKTDVNSIYTPNADPYNKQKRCQNQSRVTELKAVTNYISEYNRNETVNVTKCKEQCSHQVSNKNVVKNSLAIENKISPEKLKKNTSIAKKLSNISVQLKKLVWKDRKINNPVKSLPERTLPRYLSKQYDPLKNKSEIYHNRYIKRDEKQTSEEPKFSEKEVFSIQYSAHSES